MSEALSEICIHISDKTPKETLSSGLRVGVYRPNPEDHMHEQILQRYKPQGWDLVHTRYRTQVLKDAEKTRTDGRRKCVGIGRRSPGITDPESKIIVGPKVTDAASLSVVLHEFAHVKLNHWHKGESCLHREEFEADRWSFHIMAVEGIPVPAWIRQWSKDYVRHCIELDEAKGIKIHSPARRFIR